MNFDYGENNLSPRKRDFPVSARDALIKAEEMIRNNLASRPQLLKQSEPPMTPQELISEHVFCEFDRRAGVKKLSHLQEAELMEIFSDHMLYDKTGTDSSRFALFLAAFPSTAPHRINFLISLISLSISTKNSPLLEAAGVLFQQYGCASPYVVSVARGLVDEFFALVVSTSPVVVEFPTLSLYFAASFLTALAKGYDSNDGQTGRKFPADFLLEMIVRWVRDNPVLCLAPFIVKPPPPLAVKNVVCPEVPLAPLFRWCILSGGYDFSEEYSELYSLLVDSLEEVGGPLLSPAELILTMDQVAVQVKRGAPTEVSLERLALLLTVGYKNIPGANENKELWEHIQSLPRSVHMEAFIQKCLPGS